MVPNPASALKGKTVLITGAARGLGAATAIILADAGAEVVLAARNRQSLEAIGAAIQTRTGRRPICLQLDLSDSQQVIAFTADWQAANRTLDILVNNAATWLPGQLAQLDETAIITTVNTNVTGTILLIRGLLPVLRRSDAPDIVTIVSLSGLPHIATLGASVPFIASKAAQAAMSQALRQELRGSGIRQTVIHPPNIEDVSPLNIDQWHARPANGWVSNRDIVDTIVAALSRARHVTYFEVMLETDTANFHG